MKRWRIGIIGAGWAGDQHARAIKALRDRAEIVALADVDTEILKTQAEAWQVGWITDSYKQLLNREKLDAVSICLPHDMHAEAAILAAEAGLHILIEKPLATSLAEADAMIAAAEKAGVQLMVAEKIRFDNTNLRIQKMIQSGELGDIFLIRIAREHQMHDYLRQRPWFLKQRSAGIMVSGGIHDYELLRMLGGQIDHVYGLVSKSVFPEMLGDDTSVAVVGLQSGAVAVLSENYSLRTASPGVHGTVHGSKGSIWFHRDHIRRYMAPEDGQPDLVEDITVDARDTFKAEIEHFLDCLDSGQEALTSGRDQRQPLLAVLATYQSFDTGQRVNLAEFEAAYRAAHWEAHGV